VRPASLSACGSAQAGEDINSFEIIDGEHRYRIARSLDIKEMPCMVIQVPDAEAKIKTLQLNGLRGENEPERLARLIRDLSIDYDIDELEALIPLDKYDIQASLELLETMDMQKPDTGLEDKMEQILEEVIFSTVVTRNQKNLIEHAIARARRLKRNIDPLTGQSSDADKIPDGQLLADVCEKYLETIR
jgi:ParB family chromosome partitioning protein